MFYIFHVYDGMFSGFIIILFNASRVDASAWDILHPVGIKSYVCEGILCFSENCFPSLNIPSRGRIIKSLIFVWTVELFVGV